MTEISKDIYILISHPFCLPEGNAPINRFKRRTKFQELQRALGSNWEEFDIDGILPAVMKKRKDILLRHKVVDNKYMYDFAVDLNKKSEHLRQIVSVTHSCYVWDFGLCAVDVLITIRLVSPEGVLDLYPFAEAFEEEMLTKDLYKPPGCETWEEVKYMFSKAFEKADISTITWLTSNDAPSLLLETCCWNLQMVLAENRGTGIFVNQDLLEKSLLQFCGVKTTPESFDTGVYEFYASHTGYSGNAAIVINQEQAIRVQWLWKVVAILYSALLDSADPCYDLVTDLIQNDATSIPKTLESIRNIQKIIDLLNAEANPIAICSESFDAEIYQKVWECWGGDEISALIDKRTDFLMHTLQDLSEQKSQSLQGRLNLVVFVLTIVSIASTVAAIISLLDLVNTVDSDNRAIILGVLTGVTGVACLLIILVDWSKWQQIITKSCCRRCCSRVTVYKEVPYKQEDAIRVVDKNDME